MEPAKKPSFLEEKKSKSTDFSLFLSNLHPSTQILHSFLGLPMIPLLGKYSRDGYSLDDIRGLVLLTLDSQNGYAFQHNSQIYRLNLPKEIHTILTNIPDRIPHNKPPADPKKPPPKNPIFNFHPFKFFPMRNVKFVWEITVQNKILQVAFSKKNEENFKNIINHSWVFEELDFSQRKKLIENIPCCVVIPKSIENSCGVQIYDKTSHGINFGTLRSEYLSTHMIKDSLALSPNNMRIILDEKKILSHFWTVYLKTHTEHMVVYHWVFNELGDMAVEFLQESSSLEDFLVKIGVIIGEDHEAIMHVKQIFD